MQTVNRHAVHEAVPFIVMTIEKTFGPYPELARLIKRITGNVPRQTAANRAGVSHDTIARLWQGYRASVSTLERFAAGYNVDPHPLLVAGGYVVVETAGKTNSGNLVQIGEDADANDEESTRVLNPEEIQVLKYYRAVPLQLRPSAMSALQGFKTAGDFVREIQEANTIGKQSDREENNAVHEEEG